MNTRENRDMRWFLYGNLHAIGVAFAMATLTSFTGCILVAVVVSSLITGVGRGIEGILEERSDAS